MPMTRNPHSPPSPRTVFKPILALWRSKKGNVAVLTAFAMMAITGMAALAVDATKLVSNKMRLDNAAKIAAIAATAAAQADLTANGTSSSTYQTSASTAGANAFKANLSGNSIDTLPIPTITTSLTMTTGSSRAVVSSTVSYTGSAKTLIGGIVGHSSMTVSGNTSAAQSLNFYINIHILVDVSGSMNIGATAIDQYDMAYMQRYAQKSDGSRVILSLYGCNFACHGNWTIAPTTTVPNTVYAPTASQLSNNADGTVATPYTGVAYSTLYPAGVQTNGNTFDWAHNAGLTLRIDNVISALNAMLNTLITNQINMFCAGIAASCNDNHYKVAAWTFDNGFSGGGQDGDPTGTTGFALTTPTNAATLIQNITTPSMKDSSANPVQAVASYEVVPQATGSKNVSATVTGSQVAPYNSTSINAYIIPTGDGGTNIFNALYQLYRQITTRQPGGGTGTQADPLNAIILITDGINDNLSFISSDGQNSTRLSPKPASSVYPSQVISSGYGLNQYAITSSGPSDNFISEIDPAWCGWFKKSANSALSNDIIVSAMQINYGTIQSGSATNYINNGNSFIKSEMDNNNISSRIISCVSSSSLYQIATDSNTTTLTNALNTIIGNILIQKLQLIGTH